MSSLLTTLYRRRWECSSSTSTFHSSRCDWPSWRMGFTDRMASRSSARHEAPRLLAQGSSLYNSLTCCSGRRSSLRVDRSLDCFYTYSDSRVSRLFVSSHHHIVNVLLKCSEFIRFVNYGLCLPWYFSQLQYKSSSHFQFVSTVLHTNLPSTFLGFNRFDVLHYVRYVWKALFLFT